MPKFTCSSTDVIEDGASREITAEDAGDAAREFVDGFAKLDGWGDASFLVKVTDEADRTRTFDVTREVQADYFVDEETDDGEE